MYDIIPSLEAIAVQDTKFFNDLKSCVAKLRESGNLGTRDVVESRLEEVIFDRLKIRVEVSISNYKGPNASVRLPQLASNHIFMRPLTEVAFDSVGKTLANLDNIENRVGYVDLQKVTVGGVFSKIPIQMSMTKGILTNEFTDGEVASVILHELGHAWTYFYYLHHTTMASFISVAVATGIAGAKDDDVRSTIISKGCRVLGLDGVAIAPMLQYTKEQVSETLQTLYIGSTSGNLRSETGHGMYELKACEQLADWFAVRFGAGADSARVQEKFHKYGISLRDKNSVISRTWLASALWHGQWIIAVSMPIPLLITEMFIDDSVGLYDSDGDRVEMMVRNLIDVLRTSNLDKETADITLKDIEEMRKVVKRIRKSENRFSQRLVKYVKLKILPNYRRNIKSIELQKSIESLMFNDLHISATKATFDL